jgi:hypothetical protein
LRDEYDAKSKHHNDGNGGNYAYLAVMCSVGWAIYHLIIENYVKLFVLLLVEVYIHSRRRGEMIAREGDEPCCLDVLSGEIADAKRVSYSREGCDIPSILKEAPKRVL